MHDSACVILRAYRKLPSRTCIYSSSFWLLIVAIASDSKLSGLFNGFMKLSEVMRNFARAGDLATASENSRCASAGFFEKKVIEPSANATWLKCTVSGLSFTHTRPYCDTH